MKTWVFKSRVYDRRTSGINYFLKQTCSIRSSKIDFCCCCSSSSNSLFGKVHRKSQNVSVKKQWNCYKFNRKFYYVWVWNWVTCPHMSWFAVHLSLGSHLHQHRVSAQYCHPDSILNSLLLPHRSKNCNTFCKGINVNQKKKFTWLQENFKFTHLQKMYKGQSSKRVLHKGHQNSEYLQGSKVVNLTCAHTTIALIQMVYVVWNWAKGKCQTFLRGKDERQSTWKITAKCEAVLSA